MVGNAIAKPLKKVKAFVYFLDLKRSGSRAKSMAQMIAPKSDFVFILLAQEANPETKCQLRYEPVEFSVLVIVF